MNKNLLWKALIILLLLAFAVFKVNPRYDSETKKVTLNLKSGLDIAGGTSLIYEIDTTGLDSKESKGLAENMVPILLKRIDPKGVANIVMRPQGDTRIEIQLPVASIDTVEKRQAYDKALEELEKENINLLKVKRALGLQDRQEKFAEYAGDSELRKEILEKLANTYDQRKEKQEKRNELLKEMDEIKEKIDSQGLSGSYVENRAPSWIKMDDKTRDEAIQKYVDSSKEVEGPLNTITDLLGGKKKLIEDYMSKYSEWSEVVKDLTEPENGLDKQWEDAQKQLTELNLSTDQLTDILNMPEGQMTKKIEDLKVKFQDRADKIDAVVNAYKQYNSVGGRLDDPEDLKRMLKGAGVLEFRILPTSADGKSSASELEGFRESLQAKGPKLSSTAKYVWCEIENPSEFPSAFENIGSPVIAPFGEKYYVLASNQKNETMLQDSVTKKWRLKKAYHATDREGRRAIGFTMDTVGSNLFFNITKNNPQRPLCILLDGIAISAPTINEPIMGKGIIKGQFQEVEVQDMVNKLNAGSFPARLSEVPISEKSIGSTIGADNRDKGIKAGLIGLAAVAVFMLIYYVGSGFIADAALFMNLIFILGMMAVFEATFTLPGIAGLILTIGMSVDANVLIFERIREEQEKGSSLRTAIANGYQRAFRTIFDANITTFGVALILYMVASEEIKGFAIVLMLGIVSSMFTALFVTRLIFDFLLERRIIKDHLIMLRLFRKKPEINWMGLRGIFFFISILLIVGGLYVFITRDDVKNSKYDIEFTGGTSAQIDLKGGTDYTREIVEEKIREKGEEIGNDALAAAKVYSVGQTGLQYEITTTETNKITASVTFNEAGQTVESVTQAIAKAATKIESSLPNLAVTSDDNLTFLISTSQINKAAVNDTLNEAFADKATITEPVLNEIVSRAIREAFEGELAIREDLGIEITKEERVPDTAVELADYLGGVQFTCKLNKSVTAAELKRRFQDIRFKPDMLDISWFRYDILNTDLSQFEPEDTVSEFIYVSVHPEAGYRELDENEWTRFTANEKMKIESAGSLQTSLARVTQIDPSIGNQAKNRALVAIVMSLIAIVAYIWIRFGTAGFGFAAIAALVHDVCITLGAVTVCTYIAGTPLGEMLLIQDFKINLQMIAAFLTIIGYSLNDTIVVFDRIRENRGKLTNLTPQIISNSINQTLSRTLLTSFTTFLVVLIMYIWGGSGLRGFTFAMLIGIIVGTYSSIAIAAPILLIGSAKQKKLK